MWAMLTNKRTKRPVLVNLSMVVAAEGCPGEPPGSVYVELTTSSGATIDVLESIADVMLLLEGGVRASNRKMLDALAGRS